MIPPSFPLVVHNRLLTDAPSRTPGRVGPRPSLNGRGTRAPTPPPQNRREAPRSQSALPLAAPARLPSGESSALRRGPDPIVPAIPSGIGSPISPWEVSPLGAAASPRRKHRRRSRAGASLELTLRVARASSWTSWPAIPGAPTWRRRHSSLRGWRFCLPAPPSGLKARGLDSAGPTRDRSKKYTPEADEGPVVSAPTIEQRGNRPSTPVKTPGAFYLRSCSCPAELSGSRSRFRHQGDRVLRGDSGSGAPIIRPFATVAPATPRPSPCRARFR